MDGMHYAGLDVHKKTISFCIRRADGGIVHEGVIAATRTAVSEWMKSLPDRCNYFPECHMVSRELRDRRRALRYRSLVVRQTVRMKDRMSALMMETGLHYNKKKLHQKRYFQEMLNVLRPEMPESLPELCKRLI